MRGADRRGGERLQREVAVADAVERVGRGAVEAERRGGGVAVDRERGPGERGGAQRALVHAGAGVGEASAIAPEHLDIGEQVVTEGHGLRALQVGEAGHDAVGLFQRACRQHLLQAGDLLDEPVHGVADPEPEIHRHLVVARACRVQPSGGRADVGGEPRLDVHVDVLERALEGEAAALDFATDRL